MTSHGNDDDDNTRHDHDQPIIYKQPKRKTKGTNTNSIAPPQGVFALPPPKPRYYTQHGLRKVQPYMYAFQSYAKQRWQGRTLIDVYSEFRDRTEEYYDWAIETGAIVVNNLPATRDTVLVNGDLISNVLHRHEPPVVAGPIRIIYDGRLPGNDGETLVVEKPGSMPVHPTGRYHFNTLLEILKHDYGLPLVHTSNRLDRLTSGIMVCSLTVEASKKIGAWFGGRREGPVEKEYVARCIGKFPDDEVIVEQPLMTIDRQIGINVVHPEGRHAKTIFKRLSYDETSKPITGRSHQIRVHLQYLGHPIANDPIYQNKRAWGSNLGKGGVFPMSPQSNLNQIQVEEKVEDQNDQNQKEQEEEEQERIERQTRGNKFMSSRIQQNKGADLIDLFQQQVELNNVQVDHDEMILSNDQEKTTTITPSSSSKSDPTNKWNKRGQAIYSNSNQTNLVDQVEQDRKAHDPDLTNQAKIAIAELRCVKDEVDGWARQRDLLGIEQAKKSKSGGLLKVAQKQIESKSKDGDDGDDDDDDDEIVIDSKQDNDVLHESNGAKFCATCFTPIIPDPKPEQLFIWLHAMRYKTLEWDYCSPLPDWAESTYEVPLSSILS
ncbi:hypothetical protein OIO90_001374 [Microbotryomycetes sp. JL221]|nr:hypothetical protein OIO90_001374 [Microbotryomycetes sp. JL221]